MALFVFASLVKSLVLVFAAVTTVASFGSSERQSRSFRYVVCTLADSGFFKNYQGGVKSTVSWVFEDLWFKRAIFQTFWKDDCCPKSLFFELETSNFGYLLIFLFSLTVQSFSKIGQH